VIPDGGRPDPVQAGDREIGDEIGDLVRTLRPLRAVPVGGPVERAEKGARRDRGVGGAQQAPADAAGDERPDPAFVAVALGDDPRAQPPRQRVHLEVGRRALDVVDEAEHVGGGDVPEAPREGPAVAPRARERGEEPIERPILAEVEQLLFPAEVVIEVAGREVGGDRDLAHAGGGVPAPAEDAGRRAHDRHAARLGTFRTAVRKVNHRSILAASSLVSKFTVTAGV